MSITGVTNSLHDLLSARLDHALARPAADQVPAHDTAPKASTQAATGATATRRTSSLLTAQPPEGTDPALWSILTGEERAYFANHATSGPLTYSKVMMPNRAQAAAPSIRGGRIDVKV